MHREREVINLLRDCEVVEIPAGTTKTLKSGVEVVVIQSLGGSYTIQASDGGLYRIDERNVDAIGKVPATAPLSKEGFTPGDMKLEDRVWEQLKTCYDPEIPVDIVNLGLVYHCDVTPIEGTPDFRVDIEMTLTAPGCGMGGVLKADVERKVSGVAGVKEVNVELVFEPQWEQDMMSEAAKLQLGMY
jgi:probable FeS assembly SUF system protein SufT